MALFTSFQGNLEAFSFGVVFDEAKKPIPISRFWEDSPAILVFLRHFGCIACRAHAQDTWSQRERLEQTGSKIIFIGNGDPGAIDGFRKAYDLGDAAIYTDPTLKLFQLAGFRRGVGALVNGRSAVNMAKLALKGHKNGNPLDSENGSNFQLGGIVVVQPGAIVNYHYISESVGDVPEGEDIAENKKT